MNRKVFLSLLALDAYNRGYDEGIFIGSRGAGAVQNEGGRQVGNATIIDVPLPPGSITAVVAPYFPDSSSLVDCAMYSRGAR